MVFIGDFLYIGRFKCTIFLEIEYLYIYRAFYINVRSNYKYHIFDKIHLAL